MDEPEDGKDTDMMIGVWKDPSMRVWLPDALLGSYRAGEAAAAGRGSAGGRGGGERGRGGGQGRGGRGHGGQKTADHADSSTADDPSQEGVRLKTFIRNNNYANKEPQRLAGIKRVPGSQILQIDVVHFRKSESDDQHTIETAAIAWMNEQLQKMAADKEYDDAKALEAKQEFMKGKVAKRGKRGCTAEPDGDAQGDEAVEQAPENAGENDPKRRRVCGTTAEREADGLAPVTPPPKQKAAAASQPQRQQQSQTQQQSQQPQPHRSHDMTPPSTDSDDDNLSHEQLVMSRQAK